MYSFIKSYFLLRLPHADLWSRFAWLIIFLLPLLLWRSTSDVISYFRYGAPSGQIWYVFSKLFALYAVLMLWYQSLNTLLKETRFSNLFPRWNFLHHRILGSLTFLTIFLHIACFIIAVSLRKETIAWSLLLPDFSDFYHTSITIGLFAFLISLVALTAAVLRKHLPVKWKKMHRGMLLVVALGLGHGYLIGTETRYSIYEWFYGMIALTWLIALYLRWPLLKERRFL
jgi:DMSO/TMAO reductase YedYZ heme-binding membrane subunit